MVSGFVGDCAGRLRVEVPSPVSRAGSAHSTMVSAGQPFRLVLAVPPSRRALVVLWPLAKSEPWRRAARADRPLRRPSRPDRQREGKDPLPDGTTFVADEPGAKVTVGDGGVRIAVDRFTQSHPVQTADNCKFLVLSTEDFTLPEAGRLSFSASIAAEAINATPYDHRDGFAAFVLCDPVNGSALPRRPDSSTTARSP
ncbi:DUF6081 family protein [Streptomyces sp. MC1]|uniref:DUF6081 family protein n=1 Tax=Streptomyces sp. MC1 TaxID=295105 RepID=UPI0027DB3042|nr:DUF6081 family protein [Streptomyces sp. MC1]